MLRTDRAARACLMLSAACLLGACHPAHNATASDKVVRNELCAEEWIAYPGQPHPMWQEAGTVRPSSSGMLPKRYKAYTVAADTLQAFFRAAAQQPQVFVLPAGGGCEPFRMRVSDAMSPELRRRYPGLVSLQGNGIRNTAADLRLDWDGRQLQGQLIFNSTTYLISPVATAGGIAYLIYDKTETSGIKQPFETAPAPAAPPPVIRQKPVEYDR